MCIWAYRKAVKFYAHKEIYVTKTANITMADLLDQQPIKSLVAGDIVDGTVISAEKHELWLDLGVNGTGLVIGRELEQGAEGAQLGDTVSASVLEPETPEGYAILSLKKVAKEKGWEMLEERFKTGEVFGIVPFDANKGGLLIEIEGVRGFLPVSQLSAENYPRVSGADKDEILHRLNSLVSRTLMVRILDLDRKQNKLIVSEKAAHREMTEDKLANFKVGDKIKGIVTGVVDFGIFVNVDGIEGLRAFACWGRSPGSARGCSPARWAGEPRTPPCRPLRASRSCWASIASSCLTRRRRTWGTP